MMSDYWNSPRRIAAQSLDAEIERISAVPGLDSSQVACSVSLDKFDVVAVDAAAIPS
jgi:hypothetical protein